jgi:hypothetical protein
MKNSLMEYKESANSSNIPYVRFETDSGAYGDEIIKVRETVRERAAKEIGELIKSIQKENNRM